MSRADERRQQDDNRNSRMLYSDSMPVMDATAPYAVSPAAKIPNSSSSPRLSYDESDEPAQYHSKSTTAYDEPPSTPKNQHREKMNFTDTPATRNSVTSIKSPYTPAREPEKEVEEVEERVDERPDYHIKLVCVGDGGCGKTCLMLTYTYGTFPTTYIPTVFENYLTVIKEPNGKLIELALWDTAGQEEYDRLRVLSYPEVNILLVCFAINSPASLDNVVDKWVPEVSHFCQDVPFILVGLKSDLRKNADNTGETIPGATKSKVNISVDQAKSVAARIGANRYMECSARESEGISEVFNTAVAIVLAEHLGLPQPPIVDIPGATPAPVSSASAKKTRKLPTRASSKPPKANGKPETVSSSNADKKKKKKSKCVIL